MLISNVAFLGLYRVDERCFVMRSLQLLSGFSLASFALVLSVQAEPAGNFTLTRPSGCKPLPEVIYTTRRFKGVAPTNQWFSSLVWEKHSQNMFPHPMGVLFCEAGLSIAYPGAALVSSGDAIMGGGVSSNGDIVIGHTGIDSAASTRLDANSEWFITGVQESGDAMLKMTIGHGSPFVFCRYTGGKPRLKFAHTPTVFIQLNDSVLGVTVRGNHYGIFGAAGSSWAGVGGDTFTNKTAQDYFSVALLPDQNEQTLRMFSERAHNHVVGAETRYRFENGHLVTDYHFELETLGNSGGTGTVFATYPHQWKYVTTPLTELTYSSVRGEMKLGTGSVFSTRLPLQGVLPMLPVVGDSDRQRLLDYLRQESERPIPKTADTYWEGKHLGKLATLAGIAEVAGEEALEQEFVGEMQKRLEDWFVALPDETEGLFFYDKNWGTLIGSPASYGSDAELNDHHFHYGYFIRAAAEVARRKPEWGIKWRKMIDLLVRDIASGDSDDDLFPRLRCFDVYAGHSWASGHAKFGDGNNQESSSEAMNAWYAMILWGQVSGNDQIRDRGIYLYNTERVAIEEYWFDVSNENFPADFPELALGMVWGGKGAFATWFSGDIDCIHGINWLPFSPASIYMGRNPEYIGKNFRRITEKRKMGEDYNNGWGDLVVMFGALQDPSIGLRHLKANPQCKVEEGNTHAFMFHWLQTLNRYGVNRADVTSDHPFVNVFEKSGQTTYVVYNFDDTALLVSFSDGKTVRAVPRALTVSR
jgi:endoglucanase Acf2